MAAAAAAASVHILKSSLLTPVSISHSKFPAKSDSRKVILKSRGYKRSRCFIRKKFRVCCSVQDGDNQSNGEEPPESLFMKELRRRGMNPTSLLEETNKTDYGTDDETKSREQDGGFSKRNTVSTELDKNLSNQRERSMALNSEGLELLHVSFASAQSTYKYAVGCSCFMGLIPRAKFLLTLGGTFFLAFWPLILITVAFFSGLYFYFGPAFVHDGSDRLISPPQYVDPYALLEDERISQIAPRVK